MPTRPTKDPDTRLMTLAELADYLHVSERTVLKLATSHKLPGAMVDHRWRFKRAAIDDWLEQQLTGETEDFEEIPDGIHVPLADLMPDASLITDMRASDALSAIEELAARAYANRWLNDKPWFIGALVEREALSSTAMEGGVAFLHTRSRDTRRISRPFIIVGRSHKGIKFGSPDGKPTYLFFLLGLKYDKMHLPILGRLARFLRNPAAVAKLRSTTSPHKMRNLLLRLDAAEITNAKPPIIELPQPHFDRDMRLRTIMRIDARKKLEAKRAEEAEKKKSAKRGSGRAKAASSKQKAKAAAGESAAPARAKNGAAPGAAAAAAKAKSAAAKKSAAPAKAKSAAAAKKAAAPAKAKSATAAKKAAAPAKAKSATAAKKAAAPAKAKSAAAPAKAKKAAAPAKAKSAAAKKSAAKPKAAPRAKRKP